MKNISSLLLLLLVTIGAGACVPQHSICRNSSDTDCNPMVLQIDEPRFEFPPGNMSPSPMRADNYWLKSGDNFRAAWDSFILYIGAPGTLCNANTTINPP